MGDSLAVGLVFYGLAAMIIAGAAAIAFSRNIVHSAFALFATFAGVAGLYALLAADLLAVIQLLVYVGGILILILFAVMLTSRIADVRISNPSFGRVGGVIAMLVVAALIAFVAFSLFGRPGPTQAPETPTTGPIGDALLSTYVLPFEVISILLLAVLLGAVTLARGQHRGED
jgi:NADH-quinone oxidoreductase subunit J